MDTPAAPIRVAVVNDYPLVVEGLARIIEADARFRVVEIDVRADPVEPVDLILFDAFGQQDRLPNETERLVQTGGPGRVVLFSWNVDDALVAESMGNGAAGYLSKRLTGTELVDALARIHAGERIVDSQPMGHGDEPGDWPGRSEGLTAREAEIVALIGEGATNEQIAKRCYLSINSVKTHIRNAYRKMGVTRRAQAVRWAIEHEMRAPGSFRNATSR